MLKQDVNVPLAMEEQVVIIFAGVRGYLDKIDVASISAFEAAWLGFLKGSHQDLLDAIRTEGELSSANEAKLADLCENMVSNFAG
jgi:F-type H+-transporting ATPase subunit alpha